MKHLLWRRLGRDTGAKDARARGEQLEAKEPKW